MHENRPYPYLDDIFHHKGNTFDECLGILIEIFERLGKHGMQVNLEKSELMAETLTLLEFELTWTGSRPTSKRIEAILKLGKPKNKKGVRRINGIVNFIKNYIPNCAGIMRPHTNLTRDNVLFHFGHQQ